MTIYTDFDTANWVKVAALVGTGVSDPEGGNSAFSHSHNAASGASYIRHISDPPVPIGQVTEVSVIARGDTANWYNPNIVSLGSLALGCYFDFTNGVVGTSGADVESASIIALANGYYKGSYIFTNDTADETGQFRLYLGEADNDLSWASASGESIDIYSLEIKEYSANKSAIGVGLSVGKLGRMGAK